ncbi:MAG TPA: TatD family hydrolase [Chitinivibrionales bacterium]|nr:TatD family hydrolase [Chitinivibrionales bacterium]
MPVWTDSHAHLYDCDTAALDALIASAKKNGVHRVLNAATSLAASRTVVSQCAGRPALLCGVGISPFDVKNNPNTWETQLADLAARPGVVAIGETGIDATNPSYPDLSLQIAFFEKHLSLAIRLGLPAIIHSRGCEQKALDICVSSGVTRAVFHCYTGDEDTMKKIIGAGYYISFSGIVTFTNSPLGSLVKTASLDFMLIETDSPYLAPVPYRGKTNQPAWVALVGKKVAEMRGMDEEELSGTLERNFGRLFLKNKTAPLPTIFL